MNQFKNSSFHGEETKKGRMSIGYTHQFEFLDMLISEKRGLANFFSLR